MQLLCSRSPVAPSLPSCPHCSYELVYMKSRRGTTGNLRTGPTGAGIARRTTAGRGALLDGLLTAWTTLFKPPLRPTVLRAATEEALVVMASTALPVVMEGTLATTVLGATRRTTGRSAIRGASRRNSGRDTRAGPCVLRRRRRTVTVLGATRRTTGRKRRSLSFTPDFVSGHKCRIEHSPPWQEIGPPSLPEEATPHRGHRDHRQGPGVVSDTPGFSDSTSAKGFERIRKQARYG